jgi:hypothetical protein
MVSRRKTFGALIIGVVVLATMHNALMMVRQAPLITTTPASIAPMTSHHSTASAPRNEEASSHPLKLLHGGKHSTSSKNHDAHSSLQPRLSWEFSDSLQRSSGVVLQERGDDFLELFDRFHASEAAQVEHHILDQTCGYMNAKQHHKLVKVDYSHRVKRKGEYSTIGLYEKVKEVAGNGKDLFQFGDALPDLLNREPVQLSPEFDLSEPFGSWSTSFLAVNASLESTVDGGNKHKSKTSHHERSSHWQRMFHPPQRMEPQPPPFAALFHNAVVSHGHVVTCDGNVLTAGGCLWDFHLPAIASSKDVHKAVVAVSLCDEWCKGYYHFTHEHLPRVAVVHRLLLERNDTKLVLSHAPTGFQRQFLSDILGIPPAQIVHGKAVLGHTVVYPTPMRCGNTFTSMLYLLRRIVYTRMDLGEGPTLADPSTKLKVLFAERKHLSRMPKNYPELKQRLMHEFESDVEFETTQGDTSARQQIELFHKADIVVGPHGANIANMMWMRHGTHVIEMASRRKGNMCYYATASRINVTHHLVMHNKGKDASYVLEYDYLQKHVAFAIAALKRAASAS